MPHKFDKDLLDISLLKDNATSLETYEKLTQNTKIKFKCNCSNSYEKSFKRLTISGALCESCTNVSHSSKLSEAAKQNFTNSESYNEVVLYKFLKESEAILIGEFSKLTKETSITFRCKCGNEDSKTFVSIKATGVLCKKCTMKQRKDRRERTNLEIHGHVCTLQSKEIKKKAEETLVKRFGVTNALQSNEIKEQIKKTNLEKYGSENPFSSELIKAKLRETCKMKYGSEFPMQNSEIAAKTKATNLEKYAVEVSSKAECVKEKAKETNLLIYGKEHHITPEVVEKGKQTNLMRYGTPYSFQSQIAKEKIKKTLLLKYGVDHSSRINGILDKRINTWLSKYGVKFPMQNDLIKSKQVNTVLRKYGVKYANQSPLIQAKSQKTGLRYKSYITPSGEVRKVQGYEPKALDILFLEHKLDEANVITDRDKVPRIIYTSNNKSHYYFPDIYIPSQNKLIEVKSSWTVKLHAATNCLKWNAAVASGYNCEVWVFDKKSLNIIYNNAIDPHKISHD